MNDLFILRRSGLTSAEWQCHGRRLEPGVTAPARRPMGRRPAPSTQELQ